MATASVRTESVTKTIVEEKPVGFTLELSWEEAATLKMLLGRVAGSDNRSARLYSSNIFYSLPDLSKSYSEFYDGVIHLGNHSLKIVEDIAEEYKKRSS